jgi:hypothetical protein
MFARWSQENFFGHMTKNFGIDTLVSYLKTKISDTTPHINPQYRELENSLKKMMSRLNVRKVKFANMNLGKLPEKENNQKKFL